MNTNLEKIKELRKITGAGFSDVKKALDESGYDIKKAIKLLRIQGTLKAEKKSERKAIEGAIFISSDNKKSVLVEINSETDFVAKNENFLKLGNEIAQKILASDVTTIEEAGNLKLRDSIIKSEITNFSAIVGEKLVFRRFKVVVGTSGSYVHSNQKIGVVVSGVKIDSDTLRDISMHIAAMNPTYLSKKDIPESKIKEETDIAKKELAGALKGKPQNIADKIINGKINKIFSEMVLLEQPFVKETSKKIKDLEKNGEITSFVRFEVGESTEPNKSLPNDKEG